MTEIAAAQDALIAAYTSLRIASGQLILYGARVERARNAWQTHQWPGMGSHPYYPESGTDARKVDEAERAIEIMERKTMAVLGDIAELDGIPEGLLEELRQTDERLREAQAAAQQQAAATAAQE